VLRYFELESGEELCVPAHAGKRQINAPGGPFRPENAKSCE
jgi:hypothetical protein